MGAVDVEREADVVRDQDGGGFGGVGGIGDEEGGVILEHSAWVLGDGACWSVCQCSGRIGGEFCGVGILTVHPECFVLKMWSLADVEEDGDSQLGANCGMECVGKEETRKFKGKKKKEKMIVKTRGKSEQHILETSKRAKKGPEGGRS